MRRKIYQYFVDHPPDVFIGVDAPDFNLNLEEKLKKTGVKTVHYVSPSVWAWRQWRIHKIKKAVNLVMTLLPFENKIYDAHEVPVKFVGHPMADIIPLEIDQHAARKVLDVDTSQRLVGLLPGSRPSELKHMGELFMQTAAWCLTQEPGLQFVLPASSEKNTVYLEEIKQANFPDLPLRIVSGQARDVLAASDVALIASGTATLEAMLFKCPMVIAYRCDKLSYFIFRILLKTKHVGLPNLLARDELAPEILQKNATFENMGAALLETLRNPDKIKKLKKTFTALHQTLRCDASETAAKTVLDLVEGRL
jgi:lipid-A-disaccharide synthase